MNDRAALFLAAILLSGCVESAPDLPANEAPDSGSSLDAGDVDASSQSDADGVDAAADAAGKTDGGAAQVVTFGTTQDTFRVGMDAVDVTGRFVVQDADGNDIDCPGGVQANQIVGDTLKSARVNGDQFLFTSDQPGRTELTFSCQSLRTRVQVTVLPAPNRVTGKLAAWVRPDIGAELGTGDRIVSLENVVDGLSLKHRGSLSAPRRVGVDIKAVRFEGAQSLSFDRPISVPGGHVFLVYRSPGGVGAGPIIGGLPGASYENVIAIPGVNGTGVSLATSRYQSTTLLYEFSPDGWIVEDRNIYSFTIGAPGGDLSVSLGVGVFNPTTIARQADFSGDNDFLVEHLGSNKHVNFANGLLFELIVFDELLSAADFVAVKEYLSRRY